MQVNLLVILGLDKAKVISILPFNNSKSYNQIFSII
jgi:hypothetical protein